MLDEEVLTCFGKPVAAKDVVVANKFVGLDSLVFGLLLLRLQHGGYLLDLLLFFFLDLVLCRKLHLHLCDLERGVLFLLLILLLSIILVLMRWLKILNLVCMLELLGRLPLRSLTVLLKRHFLVTRSLLDTLGGE